MPSAGPYFCAVSCGGGGGCAVSSLAGRPDLAPGTPAFLRCRDLGVKGGPTWRQDWISLLTFLSSRAVSTLWQREKAPCFS